MSQLTDFAAEAFGSARSVIGGESVSIGGGTALSCVLNEATAERDFEMGGFGKSASLEAVASTTAFDAAYTSVVASYVGKTATARGLTWRVRSIQRGQAFTTISLIDPSDT